jgi:hypothetical protein
MATRQPKLRHREIVPAPARGAGADTFRTRASAVDLVLNLINSVRTQAFQEGFCLRQIELPIAGLDTQKEAVR